MSTYPEIDQHLARLRHVSMFVRDVEVAYARGRLGMVGGLTVGGLTVGGIDPWEAAVFVLACEAADRGGPEATRPSNDELLPSHQAHLAEIVFSVLLNEAWAREGAAVLADQLTTQGDRWGTWLAALLEPRQWGGWWSHPMRASLRHEIADALDHVATWARGRQFLRERQVHAMGVPGTVLFGHTPVGLARSSFDDPPLFWEHMMTNRPGGREWVDVPGHYWNPPYEHRPDFTSHGGTTDPAMAGTNERGWAVVQTEHAVQVGDRAYVRTQASDEHQHLGMFRADSDDGRADFVGVFVEVGPDRTAWVDMTGRGLADLAAVRAAQDAARSIDAFSRIVGESGALDSFREALADVSNSIDAVSEQTAALGESLRAMVEDVERSADTGARRRGPVGDRLWRRLERGRKR